MQKVYIYNNDHAKTRQTRNGPMSVCECYELKKMNPQTQVQRYLSGTTCSAHGRSLFWKLGTLDPEAVRVERKLRMYV